MEINSAHIDFSKIILHLNHACMPTFLFCLCRAPERSRYSDSKIDEVLILDKRTQYFINRRTSRKRGYLLNPYFCMEVKFGALFQHKND
jgi:hypothetical protein